jgi:hypothetical protein
MGGGPLLPGQALLLHLPSPLRPMQPGHPDRGLGSDLRRDASRWFRHPVAHSGGTCRPHDYQPSIQLVTSIVAFAMCFSTELTLNP